MKKKIALYFGTFNPIHIGHLIIANHLAEYTDVDEVWLVITPHNPFKKKKTLLEDHHRFELVEKACATYEKLRPSDIEFKLSQPNYTVNTLAHLTEKYPDYDFSLVMGEDNLNSLHKWKNYEVILKNHSVFVYPRLTENSSENRLKNHPKIKKIDAPIIEISSTFIRNNIAKGKSVRPLMPYEVWLYVDEMNFYRKKGK